MKLSLILCLSACVAVFSVSAADTVPVDFVKQVKPILAERCVECHNTENLLGDLNLQNRERAMQQRKQGVAIVPRQPEKSLLYLTLNLPPKDLKAMPAMGHRISKEEIAIIRRWIEEGAVWPDGKEGMITPRGKHPRDT